MTTVTRRPSGARTQPVRNSPANPGFTAVQLHGGAHLGPAASWRRGPPRGKQQATRVARREDASSRYTTRGGRDWGHAQ